MRRWLVAWWFIYTLSDASGHVLNITDSGPYTSDVACNRRRDAIVAMLTTMRQRTDFNFAVYSCEPDQIDRRMP